MSECRICLEVKRNVRCLFDPTEKKLNTTYADMLTYVASVKISIDDGITDQICLPCRKKLRDSYNFKLLILSSNTQLHQKNNSNFKRIQFNDITDVKLEISSAPNDDKYLVKEFEDIKMNLRGADDSVSYKDITIKKVEPCEVEIENEPMSVMEFLDTIKEDLGDDFDQDFDPTRHHTSSDSDEYLPPDAVEKKYDKKYKKKKKSKLSKPAKTGTGKANKVLIRPTWLDDLRLVSTLPPKKPREGPKKKYKSRCKEGMCPHCGKITKNLASHVRLHSEPRYKCDYQDCTRVFHTRAAMLRHHLTHNSERNFRCDQCVAAFYDQAMLKQHKTCHNPVKNYVCETCSKSYKRPHQLSRHVRTHNSANKTFACELCNMSFFGMFGLRHHMRVHTGERPYNCELCSQPYSYKHDFNRHCLKKHGIFLKRRSVNVMNAEVLARERVVMAELMAAARSPAPPPPPALFGGSQGALAYELAIKTLRNNPLLLSQHQ